VKIPGWIAVGASLGAALAAAHVSAGDPKYGPDAGRLHDDRSYVQSSAAPDFWALMPYYLPQQTESSCSVASVAMLMNGLRSDLPLAADDPLVTEAGLLKRAADAAWKRATKEGGSGVSLDQLGRVVQRSLTAYGFGAHEVEVVHVDSTSDEMLERLRSVLVQNEASAEDFVLISYLQGVLTGDPDGNVGHIAPIAAYDAERQRVLVLDPDRHWYEPYWVADRTLLRSMGQPHASEGQKAQARGNAVRRGFVHVRR
jgi:hypothetical protein